MHSAGLVLHPQRDSAAAVEAVLGWAAKRDIEILGLAGEIGRLDCAAIAVTAVPRVSQWAEMARMARGRGMAAAISCQARLVALVSSAIIGLP